MFKLYNNISFYGKKCALGPRNGKDKWNYRFPLPFYSDWLISLDPLNSTNQEPLVPNSKIKRKQTPSCLVTIQEGKCFMFGAETKLTLLSWQILYRKVASTWSQALTRRINCGKSYFDRHFSSGQARQKLLYCYCFGTHFSSVIRHYFGKSEQNRLRNGAR